MKRAKVKNVLLLGSGPIVIGQACEFDYSGSQACRALREEGIRVVLLNSNPATIMTDPGMADRTYIEPLTPMSVVEIIRKEGVDAILPTMGGQTALNLMLALSKIPGALDGVNIIGANLQAIHLAEDRRAFAEVAASLGLDTPRSAVVRSVEECEAFSERCGFPFIIRPSFTLGGSGQSFVYSSSELVEKINLALQESPIGEALVEESVIGWKEYELEVVRDHQDNAIIICSIENIDPMGVHTGDSITVAPAQTLTDREYQAMRSDAIKVIRRVGVETGGCNVQFAVNPKTGRRIVIEMNPRVSRSSALASKATGFPIAHVATKLALGYALSEIKNSVTGTTMACFEPPLDYVAVKIPRWHFEKFPGAKDELLPQMQSVGEVLALAGSFGEAYHKAINSLERSWPKYAAVESKNPIQAWEEEAPVLLKPAHSRRAYAVWDALASGMDCQKVAQWTGWDVWFTRNLQRFQENHQLGPRATKMLSGAQTNYEMIDTCSAETKAQTPFYYSTRAKLSSATPFATAPNPVSQTRGRVVILGSGPNRIGQGVEFDYCCVHASLSLRRMGFETIMVNCNPETVSTDPTVSTRLYLDPLHADCVKDILDYELAPAMKAGKEAYVLVQTGGQTPLNLAKEIESWGYKLLGSPTESIDLCEDRQQFASLLQSLRIPHPEFATANSFEEAIEKGRVLSYPLLVRPSYVLGGRGMKICTSEKDMVSVFAIAKEVSEDHPLFLDRFLMESIEFDVDGICDGKTAWISGVMEHVEEAGIHSGDSSCITPSFRLQSDLILKMKEYAKKIAVSCGAKGFFNIQMAISNDTIYIIEANPRASRTVPYLAKATGLPLVEWGVRVALGEKVADVVKTEILAESNYEFAKEIYAVKTPVFPFNRFKGFDPILGPEMRSTGEVMGIDKDIGGAFAKAFVAAGISLPMRGTILFSVRDSDKSRALSLAKNFKALGFKIAGTPGTAKFFVSEGISDCLEVAKIGQLPMGQDLVHFIKDGRADMVVNTTGSLDALKDGFSIRQVALKYRVPLFSTVSGAEMALKAIQTLTQKGIRPIALQDFTKSSNSTSIN